MELSIDDYTSLPPTNVALTLAIAHGLLSRLDADEIPATGVPQVNVAASQLRDRAVQLQSAWIATDAETRKRAVQPLDTALDSLWRGIHMIVSGQLELGLSRSPAAARLQVALYPEGLSFITKKFREQWAEGDKRLTKLEDATLKQDLTNVCGADVLPALQARQNEYGAALGITANDAADATARVLEPLRALRNSIRSYALKLMAAFDLEAEADAAKVARLLGAIEEARHAVRQGSQAPSPEEPIPPAPAPGN